MIRVGRVVAAAVLLAPVAGCGVVNAVNRFQDTQEYRETASQYKACLAANASNPNNCEALRLAMISDEQKARGVTAQSQNVQLTVR